MITGYPPITLVLVAGATLRLTWCRIWRTDFEVLGATLRFDLVAGAGATLRLSYPPITPLGLGLAEIWRTDFGI